jgi:Leucine-rich repeat (LRR) protein
MHRPGNHRRRTGTVAAMVALVIAMLAASGCQPAVNEASLAEQAAAVRSGQTDEIIVEKRPVSDADLSVLSNLPNVTTLILDHSDNRITDVGLSTIARLSSLTHLRIRGGDLGDDGLKSLATVKNLRIINLPHTHVTDAGLAALEELPQLEQLRIGSPKITDAGIQRLANFPALLRVHLVDVPVTDAGLEAFQKMPRLESLYIDRATASDEAFKRFFDVRPNLHVHFPDGHHDLDPHKHSHNP